MSEIRCNPLSDMGKLKETLVALLGNNEDIKKLAPHITDTTYVQGSVAENESGIFIDTYLRKVSNQRLKEVGTEIYVVCHKDALTLSEDEKTYFRNIGVYGNRVDCIVQMIHSLILETGDIRIGDMNLVDEEPIKPYSPEEDFIGKQMSYTCQSFYQRKK